MALPNQQTVDYPSFKLVIVGDGGTGCLDPENFKEFKLVKRQQLSHNVAKFTFELPTPTSVLGLPIGQHISCRYEKWYMEEIERKTAKKIRDKKMKESSNIEMTSQQQAKESKQHNKTSASFVEQDLDVFLLGGDNDR